MSNKPFSTPPGVGEITGPERALVFNANYELFVFALVLLSIANSVVLLFELSFDQRQVILIVNGTISVFFLLDFIGRVWRAPDKRNFLLVLSGWLCLIGSLPIPFFAVFRLLQTGLMARRLRQADYVSLGKVVVKRRAQNTLLAVLLAVILVLELGAFLILNVEQGARTANIKSASDALWWGIVTVATIGYGDRYPVTNEGRLVGVFMIIAGVALFSAITSFLAQWFLTPRRQAARDLGGQQKPGTSPADQIADMRQFLLERDAAHQKWLAEMEARLAALEDTLKSP